MSRVRGHVGGWTHLRSPPPEEEAPPPELQQKTPSTAPPTVLGRYYREPENMSCSPTYLNHNVLGQWLQEEHQEIQVRPRWRNLQEPWWRTAAAATANKKARFLSSHLRSCRWRRPDLLEGEERVRFTVKHLMKVENWGAWTHRSDVRCPDDRLEQTVHVTPINDNNNNNKTIKTIRIITIN